MNESKDESQEGNEPDRADVVHRALSEHNHKAMRRPMKDQVRKRENPRKFDVDKLPENEPVTDRRKRRKDKKTDDTGQYSGGGNRAD
jgi:hypothetical protein